MSYTTIDVNDFPELFIEADDAGVARRWLAGSVATIRAPKGWLMSPATEYGPGALSTPWVLFVPERGSAIQMTVISGTEAEKTQQLTDFLTNEEPSSIEGTVPLLQVGSQTSDAVLWKP